MYTFRFSFTRDWPMYSCRYRGRRLTSTDASSSDWRAEMIRSSTLHPPSRSLHGYLERLTDPLIEGRLAVQLFSRFPNGLARFFLIISQGYQRFNRFRCRTGSDPNRGDRSRHRLGGGYIKLLELVLQIENDALGGLLADPREAGQKMNILPPD